MRSDLELEVRVLKGICNAPTYVQGYLLSSVKPDHFSTSITQSIFKRIVKLHVQTSVIPTW